VIDVVTIGQRVRQLRRERNLAQGALAGISRAYLSRIENGRIRRLRVETLAVIAAGLNVDVGQLLVSAATVAAGDPFVAVLVPFACGGIPWARIAAVVRAVARRDVRELK